MSLFSFSWLTCLGHNSLRLLAMVVNNLSTEGILVMVLAFVRLCSCFDVFCIFMCLLARHFFSVIFEVGPA